MAYRATSLKYSSRCFSFLLHLIFRSLPQVAPAPVVTCFHPIPAGLAGNDSLVNRFTDSHHTIHEKLFLSFILATFKWNSIITSTLNKWLKVKRPKSLSRFDLNLNRRFIQSVSQSLQWSFDSTLKLLFLVSLISHWAKPDSKRRIFDPCLYLVDGMIFEMLTIVLTVLFLSVSCRYYPEYVLPELHFCWMKPQWGFASFANCFAARLSGNFWKKHGTRYVHYIVFQNKFCLRIPLISPDIFSGKFTIILLKLPLRSYL